MIFFESIDSFLFLRPPQAPCSRSRGIRTSLNLSRVPALPIAPARRKSMAFTGMILMIVIDSDSVDEDYDKDYEKSYEKSHKRDGDVSSRYESLFMSSGIECFTVSGKSVNGCFIHRSSSS